MSVDLPRRWAQAVNLGLEDVEVDSWSALTPGNSLTRLRTPRTFVIARPVDEGCRGRPGARLDQLRRAGQDRILVLHREHTVEPAFAKRVDSGEVDVPEAGDPYRHQPMSHGSASRVESRPKKPYRLRSLENVSASFACACATRSTYGRSASTGSIPSQSRCDGSKFR